MDTRIPLYAFSFGDALIASSPLTIPTGSGPISICYGFDSIWIGCTNTGNVERYDMSGTKTATIHLSAPQGICVGDGAVWVTDLTLNTLTRIDPTTNTIAATIPVGARPSDVCFDGDHLWTANFNSATVSKIDPNTNSVLANFVGVATNPSYRMAFDGKRVWVGDWTGGKITGIDVATGALLTVPGISQPWGMFFDGTYLYVTSYATSRLYVIAPWNGVIVCAVPLTAGGGPHDVISVGDEIWIAHSNLNNIQVLDRNTFSSKRSINTGSDPAGLCFDGSSVWVTNALGPSIMRFQVRERW